ncbi:hypothetical protein MKA27_17770 [[Clostridium] innocuum]|uniref:hypothetical protein n=1 Tax=Clostridium innocuum TaxID=1522 RepID=UPI000D6BEB63|nr:hypothetical protein [[Clostridium] innocuum]MCR0316366.1 hypothetical protein [[Clostridium] innocuum]MCR0370907.1 hypothetical protein [[Clostridium] innocuum]MCR0375639.1 hypothetical protein [[Clostridium] innocuum]MCR0560883.1 hypothetical protein [[Clostridium] innocuum]MCR0603657.1 hypothetical protein [[Clostridium] innocuum]
MKKTNGRNHIFLVLLLCLFPVVGCSKQEITPNVDSTRFESHDIALNNDSVIVTGSLKLGKEEAILLSIDAKADTKGTFKINYTKDKGSQIININNNQLLTLKNDDVEDVESETIEVDFKRGINDFLLTGDACSFDYKIKLILEDPSQIKHFRGGTAKTIIE